MQKAIGLYQQILEKNKYYIDAYLTLAYAHFMLGNSQEAIKVLNEAEAVCDQAQSKLLKSDKILTFKAYIQHMCGNSSEAKDIIKRFGKNKDIYCQVFELDLSY